MRSVGSATETRAALRCGAPAATLAAAFMLPLVAACAGKDFKSEMDHVRSWTATTRLAADRRSAHATNGALTGQLLQRADEAYSTSKQKLEKLATSDSERTAAARLLDSLHAGIHDLERVAP